jgi:hypothetical protein
LGGAGAAISRLRLGRGVAIAGAARRVPAGRPAPLFPARPLPQTPRVTMTLTFYSTSVPVFARMFDQLLHILDVAEKNAGERKIKLEVLVQARLAPDMLPLSFQVQSATDRVKLFLSRVTGRDAPVWADDEKTFDDLRARIGKAKDYLAGFSPADLDGVDDKIVTIKLGGEDRQLRAADYLLHNLYPNFFFHVATAYDILRHNGVPVGKRDFTGPVPPIAG